MNLGLISLIALLAAIVIGFVRKANVGILCIGFSMILGLVYGIKAGDIIKGFSSSLCMQMIGITYLFAIINENGTLELLAKKMVALVGPHKALIPFVMYLLGFLICAVGPGAIPSLAIVPVIAIPVAISAGVNPIMTAIIGDLGVMSGRMSPLTPESAVVRELMEAQGLAGNTVPIMMCLTVTALVVAVLVYIYYKGWKVAPHTAHEDVLPKFSKNQWLSLAGLAALAIGALFFSWNVGLTGFTVGSVLIVLGCGDEKTAFKMIPWNVIIMVLGVVFPTLIPTASGLAASIGGVTALELVSVIVIGGTVSGFTPISTTGALIMAGVAQQEDADEKFPQNRLFVELFAVSFIALAVLAVFAFIGIYKIIA